MCFKEKKCLDKINVTKNALLFLSRVTTHHSFPFNPQFLYELEHMAHLSKTMCGIFNFCFRLVFIKFYIFVHKFMDSLTLKLHNSFQNKNNRKARHSFAARPLIFKFSTRSFKSQWYPHELELPKNWPGNELFELRKLEFWVRHFFSTVTFK